MTPESGDGGRFIVSFCFQAISEEIVSQDAGLREAIASAADFEVYPAVFVPSMKVVFVDEFGWDVGVFYADLFGVLHWCVKVEVF